MTSVSEQGREVQMQPHDALSGDCPSRCVGTGTCRGDHAGKAYGTTAVPQEGHAGPEGARGVGNQPTADELVAAVQALQDERDELSRRLDSIGRQEGAAYVSRRPSWADSTTMGAEVITHTWTAPTAAECFGETDFEPYPVKVQVIQQEDLYVNQDGVVLDRGPMRIYLSDLSIDDTVNGRKLAAAILECCDRIDVTNR